MNYKLPWTNFKINKSRSVLSIHIGKLTFQRDLQGLAPPAGLIWARLLYIIIIRLLNIRQKADVLQ